MDQRARLLNRWYGSASVRNHSSRGRARMPPDRPCVVAPLFIVPLRCKLARTNVRVDEELAQWLHSLRAKKVGLQDTTMTIPVLEPEMAALQSGTFRRWPRKSG